MIFVTVGTHEQSFDRLVKAVDKLESDEEVIIQTGYTSYNPVHCKWQKMFGAKEMNRLVYEARIVITHGGPSSFMHALQMGKIPIVVPRWQKFKEHVNDHQVVFVQEMVKQYNNIIPVLHIEDLQYTVQNYDRIIQEMRIAFVSNNDQFNKQLIETVLRL